MSDCERKCLQKQLDRVTNQQSVIQSLMDIAVQIFRSIGHLNIGKLLEKIAVHVLFTLSVF